MKKVFEKDLSVAQKMALAELQERVEVAQRRSSRTKAILLLGPVINVAGAYEDPGTQVAEALAQVNGDYVNFSQHHLHDFLEASGVAHDPSRLRATSLTNYLYAICEKCDGSFLVVDKLHVVLRFLCPGSGSVPSEQELLVRNLGTVMFPKPLVLVLPLFPEDRHWITRETITQLLGSAEKWVYLEVTEIDRAFLNERVAGPELPQDHGG